MTATALEPHTCPKCGRGWYPSVCQHSVNVNVNGGYAYVGSCRGYEQPRECPNCNEKTARRNQFYVDRGYPPWRYADELPELVNSQIDGWW